MDVAPETAHCAIRISLGRGTTAAEIDHLVEAWSALYARSGANRADAA
jgi:cysteine sulfinate desulfinase/cysteine desulfurase-like protein